MSDTQTPPLAPAPGPEGPPPSPGLPGPAAGKSMNGLAIAGFVLALLGFLGSFIPVVNIFAMGLAVLGLILAGIGLAKSAKLGAGKGLAIAGLILGVLALIFSIAINAVFVKTVNDAADEATTSQVQAPGTSADQDAPEGANAAGEVGRTRSNPAPLGAELTSADREWIVTINTVTTTDRDSLGQTPKAGHTLLVVNVTATYKGDDEQGATPWAHVSFVTPEGNTLDPTSGSTLFLADDSFDTLKTLYSGASTTGNQLIEVPADNWGKGVLAVATDLGTKDVFVAVK